MNNQRRKNYPRQARGKGFVNTQGYRAGCIAELPVLRYGRNSNYEEFKRKITIYAEREYRQLASFFRTNQYFVPQPMEGAFDEEDIDEENDPHGLVRAQLIEETRLRVRLIVKMNNDKPALFAVMWGQLSTESEQVIMQHPRWNVIQERDDPLELWRAIRDTHVVNAVGQNQVDRMIAREQYGRLRQQPNENITQFKERTDEAIRAMQSYGVPVPPEEDLASDFINRLDKARYANFQAELMNSVTIGNIPYPNTLLDAFNKASRYRVVHAKQRSGTGGEVYVQSVFVGAADQYNKPKQAQGNKKEGKNNHKTKKDVEKKNNNGNQNRNDNPNNNNNRGNSDNNHNNNNRFKGCYICGSNDHWARNCDRLGECREYISQRNEHANHVVHDDDPGLDFVAVTLAQANHINGETINRQTHLKKTDVLLDNQATKGVFHNVDLLADVRKVSVITRFTGLGGVIECDAVGEVKDFGTVSFAPQAVANILSFAEVADKYKIEYVNEVGFIVHGKSQTYVFKRKGNLFVCDFAGMDQTVMISTVSENELSYTRREVEDARKARELMKELGYPSEASMIELITTGGILNCPVTAHDVHRATKLWGKDVASMKGKEKLVKSKKVKFEFVPRPVVSHLVLHIDLMMVESVIFLISVSTPLGLTIVTHLPNGKGAKSIWRALQDQIYAYRAERFTIGTILTDGEPAVRANAQEINKLGIKLDLAGPGQHVPVAESKIRVIKERTRAGASVLPFSMNKLILRYLIYYVTQRINMLPSASKTEARVSPFEAFRGRKLDYNRDVRIAFGTYVQATRVNIVSRNDLTPRTDGAIALLPTCNGQGSVKFFSLNTREIITRDRWRVLPMPDEVIDYLNMLAKVDNEQKLPSKEPIFRYGKDKQLFEADSGNEEIEEEEIQQELNEQYDPPTKITGDGLGDLIVSEPEYINEQQSSNDRTEQSVIDDVEILEEDNSQNVSDESNTDMTQDEVRPALIHGRNTRSQKTYGENDRTWEYGLNITTKEAMRRFGEAETIRVARLEMKQMIDLDVFEPINKEENQYKWLKTIRCFMFYKDKYDAMGEFEKLKARIVANDTNPDMTVYVDKSSPTVSLTAVMTIISIAARERRYVKVVDIAGAYLNALIRNKTILMFIEPELAKILVSLDKKYRSFLRKDGSLIVKLKKALYGCVESAKLWYDHLTTGLKEIGFVQNLLDGCVFNRVNKNNKQCTICLYVDDLLITSEDSDDINSVIDYLNKTYKTISVKEGPVISYLGMSLDFSVVGKVKVSMDGYVKEILSGYDVKGYAVTPATNDLFDINKFNSLLNQQDKDIFHSRVAKLLYLAKRVRPDLLVSCSFLASRVNCATEHDMMKLNRILRYINSTPKASIVLGLGGEDIQLIAYIDASYGIHSDGKGQTGCLITLGDEGPIYCRSSKQKLVAKSSAEAELIGVSDEYSQVIWCRDFLIQQGYKMNAAKVYQDNKSTIAMMKKGSHSGHRSRHIHVRYFFVKDRMDSGEVIVEYLPTAEMKSDILTKPLQGILFKKMRDGMMIVED